VRTAAASLASNRHHGSAPGRDSRARSALQLSQSPTPLAAAVTWIFLTVESGLGTHWLYVHRGIKRSSAILEKLFVSRAI
jgi:hypothetical protein